MSSIFTEFENENALRDYPFASGCLVKDTDGTGIGTGILIDAALYPVNPAGELYLSSISANGVVEISDDTGSIMSATLEPGASTLEFYDNSGFSRHVGTLVGSSVEALSAFVNVPEERKFKRENAIFAASCVFPIVNDGVTGINVGSTGWLQGNVQFTNSDDDEVRVSSDGSTLRFDVVPAIEAADLSSIKHIYCIVDGHTPFRISKPDFGDGSPSNTVELTLDNIDKSVVCANAHREDTLEMTDTCDCSSSSSEEPVEIPYTYQEAVVDMDGNAEGAFYLAVPSVTGYANPLSVTLEDGVVLPKTEIDVEVGDDNLSKIEDSIASKGVILQIPGMAVQ